ncbi:MAG TPA: hypothetical protein VGU24_03215 [Microvirga sp.]|jgi:hypothetical protein|nr:hypothetical protein [Microvirga sp.]
MKLLIATPAHGGHVKTAYVKSLVDAQKALMRQGVDCEYMTLASANIANARSFFGTYVLEREDITHLLFIDSDMTFKPLSVERLLSARKAVIGHIYPRKVLSFDKLFEEARSATSREDAMAASVEYVVRHRPGTSSLRVENGLIPVDGVGMGLCLIERQVFERLAATKKIPEHPATARRFGPHLRGTFYGFFDYIVDAGETLSEDLSFCKRWVEACGGDVWGVVTDEIGHIGEATPNAPYMARLRRGLA